MLNRNYLTDRRVELRQNFSPVVRARLIASQPVGTNNPKVPTRLQSFDHLTIHEP